MGRRRPRLTPHPGAAPERGVREVLKGAVRLQSASLSEDERDDVISIEAMGQK